MNNATGSTGTLNVTESEAGVGDFIVTTNLALDDRHVVLSRDQATPFTAVLLNDQVVEASLPTGAVWAAEGTISYTVTYTGTTGTAAEINAVWQSLISGNNMNFSVVASGDLAAKVRFVTSASLLATKANGEKAVEPNAHIPTTGTGTGSSWTTATITLAAKVYIALTGSEFSDDAIKTQTATLTASYVSLTDAA